MPLERNSATREPLITTLRQRALDIVGSLVPRDRPLALLDFPRHSNVGDTAIWLGEVSCLASCGVRQRDVRYVCDVTTYDEGTLRSAIGEEGVILLHGGGNFGDLWGEHQRFRETIVAAFPRNAIVALPQTIYYRDRTELDRTIRAFNEHENLTLLVRDHPSLEILKGNFRATAHLCPDLAFCLGALRRPLEPDRSIMYLARTDKEARAKGEQLGEGTVEACDWPAVGAAWQWRVGRSVARFGLDHPRLQRGFREPVMFVARRTYNAMAEERVRAGCALLAHGRVVVTDRLHAHILSLLMGIPNVLLDNSYGKVRRFYDDWTSSSKLTHFAQTPQEALAIARALVSQRPPDDRRA